MMTAEASKQQFITSLVSWAFVLGLLVLMIAGIAWTWANRSSATPEETQDYAVYAGIAWNVGFFLLLAGIFGTAVMRKDLDPLGRLLLWLVALILVLLLFVAPGTFFTQPPRP